MPSMGSVGDAYDNAMAESFFATLEAENSKLKRKSRRQTLDLNEIACRPQRPVTQFAV